MAVRGVRQPMEHVGRDRRKCEAGELTLPTLDRQIPTILSYVAGDEYTGVQAKNFLVRNPQNTVAFFRDFLGKE